MPPTDSPASTARLPADGNPYAAPAAPRRQLAEHAGRESFSHQAARFSFYAPFVLVALGCCVRGPMDSNQGNDAGRWLALGIGGLSAATTLAAIGLGIAGLIGGISRGAPRTILFAAFGVLLNLGYASLWAFALVEALRIGG